MATIMDIRAKAVKTLYLCGKIDKTGIRKAVVDNVITKEQFEEITGQQY